MKKLFSYLCFLVLANCAPAWAAPSGILANQGKLKPSISVAWSRADKLVKAVETPADRASGTAAVYRYQVVSGAEKVSAKVVASLADAYFDAPFDFAGISSETVLGLSVGDFSFSSTVGEASSKTVGANGKAVFNFVRETPVLDAQGNPKLDRNGNEMVTRKTLGSLSFVWSARTKSVTVTLTGVIPEGGALEGEVLAGIAPRFFESAGVSSGTVSFANEAVPVSVTFGDVTGERNAWAGVKVGTKVSFLRANAGDAYEDFAVSSVVLAGAADTTGPVLTVTLPAKADASGAAAVKVTLTERGAPTSGAGGGGLPTVEVLGNPAAGSLEAGDAAGSVTLGYVDKTGASVAEGMELSAKGVGYLAGTLGAQGLGLASNVVKVVATDSEGNQTVVEKKVAGPSTSGGGGTGGSEMPAMVLIPAGSYTRGDVVGDGGGLNNDNPVQTINVSAFSIAKNLTTKAQWDAVRAWGATRGYSDLPEGTGKASNHPVVYVTWYDVVKWCNAASEKAGKKACYKVSGVVYREGESAEVTCDWSANGYRLPTEAEWEKAARGKLVGKRFPWGDTISHSQANYYSDSGYSYDVSPTRGCHPLYSNHDDGNFPYTSPVGSFPGNGYGLYDMAGNAFQWCWDWYGDYVAQSNPRGGDSGGYRVIRGGSWDDGAGRCAVGSRNISFSNPTGSGSYDVSLGFRLALSSVP